MSANHGDSLPRCVWETGAELGEGPVWVARERALYFVDIVGRAIHRWQDGVHQSWSTPADPGFIFPCAGGGFICGLRGGLYRFEAATGIFDLLLPVEADKPRHRINDGFVDTAGRLWFGTMHEDTQTPGGALYRVDGLRLQVQDQGYTVTNGPVMSPDGATLYHTDSARRTVYAFEHAAGGIGNKRPFITFPADVNPDGMAVDAAGHLWIALFNGWRIERYSAEGKKVGEIFFPCAHVTKPVFGDADLRTVYVTSAKIGLSADERLHQPKAGALFAARVSVPGLPSVDVKID